ncbi:GPI-anchored protein LLG1 isoform X2 [Physcomitrium patens]|uniref:GPI-anchored protein LLG1-like domain-containing protein n=1 Tax=Physcomitrium patens TaxID=3218 RepID=A0A7I4EAA0_PHYPA|nr:GPI-anchored protein LLG1-like isoform X2 [Physcomitrium patens]XP_024381930.1 GPI-anchored protein LLG1-like isoform X2 [Physcomitrium patens]XP_024381931.1 GPI-anchored protein LLG1-like isoform X2 [Physcomitrium patens]|eukprot:XP_024381929.1 GPI-anchored protein LLG1-like isoform X2 [Physcomitrella patens]
MCADSVSVQSLLRECPSDDWRTVVASEGSGDLATGNGESEVKTFGAGFLTRHILQTQGHCPIEFSTINYTVVTSVCKVIQDHNMSEVNNQTVCCESFALLACPYADLLNNETLLCATDLFANLNYQGSYPGGIFQNCGDGNGVACPSTPPPNPNQTNATMDVPWTFFIILLSLMSLVNCHW